MNFDSYVLRDAGSINYCSARRTIQKELHELLFQILEIGWAFCSIPPTITTPLKMLSMLGIQSASQDQGHEYQSPTPTGVVYSTFLLYSAVLIVSPKDLRSPCPFLNAMANHVSLSMLKLVWF